MPFPTFLPPAPVPGTCQRTVCISSFSSKSTFLSPLRCRTRPISVNQPNPPKCRSARTPERMSVLPTTNSDNSNAQQGNSDQPPSLSRRAFLAALALSVTSFALSGKREEAKAAIQPLLDKDFSPEGGDTDPTELELGPSLESSFESPATRADYERALRIPPIDYTAVAKSWAVNSLLVGIPVLISSTIIGLQFRLSPRMTLPVTYDVTALQRYFSLRPDVVLRRLAQFAFEGSNLILGILLDRVLNTIDSKPSHKRKRAKRRAIALRDAITRLGPATIKLGQAAASRSDLLPIAVIRELQPLQDDVLAEYPSGQAFQVISEELGAPVSSVFDQLNETPVAGASLGMVFKGVIDGVSVAVKVQRPEVAYSIALDCYILRSLAQFATRTFNLRTDWCAAVDEYSSHLFEELDYNNELANMQRFRELYSHLPGIYLPRSYPAYSSRRVLVSEWVDGVKLIDKMARVRPQDVGIVETGIRFALIQLLDKGFLHADMHNGNMLRTKSGYLAYIDFGLVSEVPLCVRESIVCALAHLVHGEYSLLAECFSGLELMRSDDVEVELPALAEALREQFGSSDPGDFTLVGVASKLLMLGTRFPFVFRDYFLNNLRCLGMLEGLALSADPDFRVLDVVYPFIAQKLLLTRSKQGRYRHALEQLVIDPYGRMRWTRIQGLVADANVDTKIEDLATKRLPSFSHLTTVDHTTSHTDSHEHTHSSGKQEYESHLTGEVKEALGAGAKKTKGPAELNNKLILDFIASDAGGFLRSYMIEGYVMRKQFQWRRAVDTFLSENDPTSGDTVEVDSPVSIDLSKGASEGSVSDAASSARKEDGNAVVADTPNVGFMEGDEYFNATTRELSDESTMHMFKGASLTDRMRVFLRFAPVILIPLLRTVVAVVAYAISRAFQKIQKHTRLRTRGSTVVVDVQKVEKETKTEGEVLAGSNGVAPYESNGVGSPTVASGSTEINGVIVPWRPMDSSFVRRTREAAFSSK